MKTLITIQQAEPLLRDGGIIAYPTEAVYGLGCDPLNEQAVLRLLHLKNRAVAKGLILIAASWEQVAPFVDIQHLPSERPNAALTTWPGPITWIFPASTYTPRWIRGEHSSIAIRVTAHPVAAALCTALGRPIVSTSANRQGESPAQTVTAVSAIFGDQLDGIVGGELGGLLQPSKMIDVVSGEVVRT
ncbi:MAG: Sua5/YciO/YrdC/YwlC family protein [Gammaproteobacteria bacterium]